MASVRIYPSVSIKVNVCLHECTQSRAKPFDIEDKAGDIVTHWRTDRTMSSKSIWFYENTSKFTNFYVNTLSSTGFRKTGEFFFVFRSDTAKLNSLKLPKYTVHNF